MLDESDMKELHIYDEADCARGETRLAIRTLLERAKTQIGFNTEGSEIFVQLYTSKKGGCELFITKSDPLPLLSAEGDRPEKRKPQKKEVQQKKKLPENSCNVAPRTESQGDQKRSTFGKMIFSFESLQDICSVCRILNNRAHDIKSQAYRGIQNDFYLVLENTNMSAYSRLDFMTFILEFGHRERADHINTYLSEYGRLICPERALETLSQF